MALVHGKKIKVFALNSNQPLAKDIADYIGVELSECEVKRFADGEVQININETVRGHEVFVVQTTCAPVNDHYMELLIMIDALKRASADTINVVKNVSRKNNLPLFGLNSLAYNFPFIMWNHMDDNSENNI